MAVNLNQINRIKSTKLSGDKTIYLEEHLLVDEFAERGDAVEQVFMDLFPL